MICMKAKATSRISRPARVRRSLTSPLISSQGAGASSPRSWTDARPASVSANSLRPSVSSRADQALVLELLQRRIDRAGARAPDAVTALLDLLHDLVAVARLLGEQQQRRRADVAAARLAAATARSARSEAGPNPPNGPPPKSVVAR